MGRGKLALEYIVKDRSRRTTFEKRKKGLLKKAEEFSILCGVDTCMIIYNADESPSRGPTVWPQDPEKAKKVIERYLSEGVDRRRRHAMGLPEFFVGRKRKVDGELAKVRSANWAAKYPVSDEMVSGLSQDQLRSLLSVLGMKLESAKKRLMAVKESAARNSLGISPMGHIMDEFTFNRPVINPQINDYGFIMEPPLDIAPLVINSYLPQLMDSTMVNNPFMWPVVSGSAGSNTQNSSIAGNTTQNSSIAGNTTQNSSIAGNTTQNSSNNYYCNYTIPADCNSHYLSTPAHQSLPPDTTIYQYDSLVGAGSLSAPDNNSTLPFDYSGQGMMGCASSMMMPVPLQQKPPSPPSPALQQQQQQQQLLLEYPMMMRGLEGGSMNPSLMYGRYDQQRAAAFHGLDGNSDKMMFSSIGGNQKLPQV